MKKLLQKVAIAVFGKKRVSVQAYKLGAALVLIEGQYITRFEKLADNHYVVESDISVINIIILEGL